MSNLTSIRKTFGIIDPKTSLPYEDIVDCHLELLVITHSKILPNSVLYDGHNDCYTLHLDYKLTKALKIEGVVRVIVSFQKRTTGNIALARIFMKDKPAKRKEIIS